MRRPILLVCAGLCGLVLALAGCGGGGSKSSATPSTEATTTTTQTTTTAATTTTATTTNQSTTAAPSFATSGNCKDLAESASKFSKALTGAEGDVKKQAQLFQEFANKAPSEIRSDVQTIADAFTKIANAGVSFKAGQTPSADQLAKLQQALKGINQAKVTQASQNIAAWTQKNCHA
jgi:hypothetical protein